MKYSECTTAVNGGFARRCGAGELYPELGRVAFTLEVGELSRVVESPMGFHLIDCVSAESGCEQPLSLVRRKFAPIWSSPVAGRRNESGLRHSSGKRRKEIRRNVVLLIAGERYGFSHIRLLIDWGGWPP